MKIGFYYHQPVVIKNNEIYVPSYIGVFLDGLATYVEELVLFLHKPKNVNEIKSCDYKLKNKNIKVILLQKKYHIFIRSIFSYKDYFKISKELKLLDLIIIRTPTPLLGFFYKIAIKNNVKICLYIVGDYFDNFKFVFLKNPFIIKNILLYVYFFNFNRKLNNIISKNKCILIANNKYIMNKINNDKIYFVPSTTINKKDFLYEKKEFCFNPIKLLYVGRIEKSKGLDVLIKALKILIDKGFNTELHVVGWDPSNQQNYILELKNLIAELNLNSKVIFHGRKKVGKELLSFYRNSDILIVPTKGNEGFPRVIWEAFSQKTPVIATKTGGIPLILKDKVHALLVERSNEIQIVQNVIMLKQNKELLWKIVNNGYKLALSNTIENRAKEFIQIIKRSIDGKKNIQNF